MSGPGAPLRFLALLLLLWVGARAAWLWSEQARDTSRAATSISDKIPANKSVSTTRKADAVPSLILSPGQSDLSRDKKPERDTIQARRDRPLANGGTAKKKENVRMALIGPHTARQSPSFTAPDAPVVSDEPESARPTSRWSGTAWLFGRKGADAESLATTGQLGGSQAGARLRWRVNSDGPAITALTARISTPLEQRNAAEASIGAEWHPLRGKPLWVAVERRVALGKAARNAWSGYVAGGIWKPDLPLGTIAEGYVQAGLVGAKSRDLFADGGLRLSKPIADEDGVRAGVGIWGAAQPGVSRVDVGPQMIVPVAVDTQRFSISIDLRVRVAGNAAPGSGLAVTLGTDF